MTRRRRARMWARWAARDARRRWIQIASIALLLGLGVGFYASLGSMSAWRRTSMEKSFRALRMHDLRVSLPDGATVRAGTLRDAARDPAITVAQERLAVSVQVDASRDGRTIIVPGRLVGAPVDGAIDALDVRRGRALRPADDGHAVGEIEQAFGREYDLPATGVLRLPGGRRLRWVGHAQTPEYFIVTAPGADFGAEANFAVVFTPLRTAQRLSGLRGRVDELVLRVRPGTDVAALQRRLAARPALAGATFTTAHAEPARRLLEKDADGDQQTMNIFASLLLGAATFAAFNLISRAIEAQRREIGIGMALGVPPRALARRPLLLGTQIAAAGVVLGIPVGLWANAMFADVMRTFYPLPVLEPAVRTNVFLQGAALGVTLPLLATALPLRRALSVAPVEAIRVGARAAGSSGLAWMLRRVRLPGGSLGNLPVRNVLRAPRRTVMTLLGIGAVVSIVIALAGMMDSFDRTLAASRSEALAGAPGRLVVDLAQPTLPDAAVVRAVRRSPAVGASDASLRFGAVLRGAGGQHVTSFVEIVPRAPRLWHATLDEGALPADRAGIVISRRAADDLGVGVGDSVGVRHPVSAGGDRYRMVTTPLRVTGIHTSPFRFVAYAAEPSRLSLGLLGAVNRLSVVPAAGRSADDVKRALLRLPEVSGVQGAAAMTDAVDTRMAQFTDVILITVAVAMIMALLIAYNATAINADERAREHATMFAYGVDVRRVTTGAMAEAAIIGVLGTLAGLGLGVALLGWIVKGILPTTMPDVGTLVAVYPVTIALAVIAGTVVVALAPLLSVRRLRRTDIPSTLRVVE